MYRLLCLASLAWGFAPSHTPAAPRSVMTALKTDILKGHHGVSGLSKEEMLEKAIMARVMKEEKLAAAMPEANPPPKAAKAPKPRPLHKAPKVDFFASMMKALDGPTNGGDADWADHPYGRYRGKHWSRARHSEYEGDYGDFAP